jgi:SAM-dependent methyltransferase
VNVEGADAASFRDHSSHVFYVGTEVRRALNEDAAADWRHLEASALFADAVRQGRIIGTSAIADCEGADLAAAVLVHERVPVISYPYEWPFSMLRDAAVLQLELLLGALDEQMTLKDGSSYNVQWFGRRPTFIDVPSFQRDPVGTPWAGYRQFCETNLYPLLIEARRGVPYQMLLRGQPEGIPVWMMRKLLRPIDALRPSVLKHVHLQALLNDRAATPTQQVQGELLRSGFNRDMTRAVARNLLRLVAALRPATRSDWSSYRNTCSYSPRDRTTKEAVVTAAAESIRPQLVLDIGCNDGHFARLVAPHSGYVVAIDSDPVAVDSMYTSLRGGPANILPLVVDIANPSPASGWRNTERQALARRLSPDLVLCLAVVHHLAITNNVALRGIVDWLADFDARVIVEFADRDDPMVQRLLGSKASAQHSDYGIEQWERELTRRFVVESRTALTSSQRVLYTAAPVA